MAASTSRIVVDAGGRTFHTTRDTLLMSGAGYFTAVVRGCWAQRQAFEDRSHGDLVDFRRPLNLCLSGGERETVVLYSFGHADWHIVYWVGDAEAIPGLKSPDADARGRNMARLQAAKAGGDDSDDMFTSLLAMQLLSR